MLVTSLLKDKERNALGSIAIAVVAMHLIFLLFLIIHPQPAPLKVAPRKVVVKTVSLQPRQTHVSASPVPASSSKASIKSAAKKESFAAPKKEPPAPAKKESPRQAKKETPKEAKKDSPPAVKQPAPKESSPPLVKKLEKGGSAQESISKIQENLSKIQTKSLQDISAIDIPDRLVALAVDALPDSDEVGMTTAETHYRDELARRLRSFLILPESGEVVVKLTLNRLGNVLKLSVTSATSSANKKYVEQHVPHLAFPSFGAYFGGEMQHSFTIALRSEL